MFWFGFTKEANITYSNIWGTRTRMGICIPSWLVWITFIFAIHLKLMLYVRQIRAWRTRASSSFIIWAVIKSLFLSISETELRLISNWYVHRHIVFETSGLVITGGVAFLRLLVGYLRWIHGCESVFHLRYVNCLSGRSRSIEVSPGLSSGIYWIIRMDCVFLGQKVLDAFRMYKWIPHLKNYDQFGKPLVSFLYKDILNHTNLNIKGYNDWFILSILFFTPFLYR